MNLYLVRHGDAKPKEEDPQRPLSQAGVEVARRVAAALRGRGISIDEIRHSTKLRARQTAEILAEVGGFGARLREVDYLEPLAEVDAAADAASRETTNLMLVGHLPHLSRLASKLVAGAPDREEYSLPACGVLRLERGGAAAEPEGPSVWRVGWVIDPGLLF